MRDGGIAVIATWEFGYLPHAAFGGPVEGEYLVPPVLMCKVRLADAN